MPISLEMEISAFLFFFELQNRIYYENLNKFFIFLFVGSRRPHLFLLKSLDLISKIGDFQKKRVVRPPPFLFYLIVNSEKSWKIRLEGNFVI